MYFEYVEIAKYEFTKMQKSKEKNKLHIDTIIKVLLWKLKIYKSFKKLSIFMIFC